jgi:NADH-dependant formate dehydrogenase delta subunit FdsD
MEIHHLVTMANQVGDYFAAYPDRAEAVRDIAKHLKDFWDPRMRRQIGEYVSQSGGPDLKEMVREAIRTLEHER